MNLFIKYQKIFLALGFVVTIFVLGYFLYALFFKPAQQPSSQTIPGATSSISKLPASQEGAQQVIDTQTLSQTGQITSGQQTADQVAKGGITNINKISKTPVKQATLAGNGADMQYYNESDGKFYRVNKDGKIEELSSKTFHSVENVIWSPQKNKAILEYPDGANIVYNFDNDTQTTLPKHWEDFNFSPEGDKLVLKSIGMDPDNRWLSIVNEDGSKARRIEALGENESSVYTSWSPNNQSIAMYTEGVDFNRQEVFFVGLNNENFKSTVVEGRGFQPKWAPEGDRLLYSVYSTDNDLKPSLWIVNAQGDSIGTSRKQLQVNTWAEKCVFADNTNLYCAVPEELEEGAGLFPDLALNTRDILYEINTVTGLKKLTAIPSEDVNMENLTLSDNGYYLYFTDQTTNELNSIKLK